MHRNPDIEALVQRFYDLMRTGGSPAQLLSPQLTVVVGTDDEEWWDDYGAVITAYVTQFAAMGACTVQASSPPRVQPRRDRLVRGPGLVHPPRR